MRGNPFIGRVHERAWLGDHLAAVRDGQGAFAVVAGPPGVGKTRLVREVVEDAGPIWARSWHGTDAPPLWPITQVCHALQRRVPEVIARHRPALATLLPALGDASQVGNFALYQAVIDAVCDAAERAPVVLVCDDLHAADPSTLDLLQLAEPAWRQCAVLVIATRRTTDTRTDPDTDRKVARLCQLADEVVLGGLTPDEVRELGLQLGHPARDAEVDAWMNRAGGVPLYLEALLRTGLPSDAGGLPRSLRAVLTDRMGQLPDDVLAILRRAALCHALVDPDLVADSLRRARTDVVHALGVGEREGLVEPAGVAWAWTHQLYAEALRASQPPDALREGHVALLEGLEASAAPSVEARAHHALAAGLPSASGLLRAAGGSAEAMFAYGTAADRYARAAQVANDPAERQRVLVDRARALHRAGDLTGARRALEIARRFPVDAARLEIACTLADFTPFGLAAPEAERLLAAALADLPADDWLGRAQVSPRLAIVRLNVNPADPTIEPLLRQGLEAARLAGDPKLSLLAGLAAMRLWRADRLQQRSAILNELFALREALPDPESALEIARWAFNTALERCDGGAARDALDRYARAAETLRRPQQKMNTMLRRATLLQLEGRFDAVDGPAIEAAGRAAGDPHADYFHGACLVYGAALRGERDTLLRWTDVITEATARDWSHPGVRMQGVWLQLQLGDDAPVERAYAEWRALDFSRPPWWGALQGLAVLADIALARGDRDGAERLLERMAPYPEGYAGAGPALPFGPLARFEAKLLRFLGRDAAADEATARALRLCDRLGAPGSAALIRAEQSVRRAGGRAAPRDRTVEMIEEAQGWRFVIDGRSLRLRASRGWSHVARIVATGQPVHVLELTSGERRADVAGSAGPQLDAQARRAYAERARTLYEELDEAERHHDLGRVELVQAELDALTESLAQATGLGGRDRLAASNAERARSAVKQAIRRAIAALRDAHEELAEHLTRSVRTGLLCRYAPEQRGLRVVVTRSR